MAMLECLREAVAEELDKKRRLGHYAVFWKNGRAVCEGEDAPTEEEIQQALKDFSALNE